MVFGQFLCGRVGSGSDGGNDEGDANSDRGDED